MSPNFVHPQFRSSLAMGRDRLKEIVETIKSPTKA